MCIRDRSRALGAFDVAHDASVEAHDVVGVSTDRAVCVRGDDGIGNAGCAVGDQGRAGDASERGGRVEHLGGLLADAGAAGEDVGGLA